MPRRGRKAARRLVDPVAEIDVDYLIKLLTKYRRVNRDELTAYREVPQEYLNEIPAVRAKNRGLNTIYGKVGHLRRRYLWLLLNANEESEEGVYVQKKLLVFEKEIALIIKEIRALGGAHYTVPHVFARSIALRG